jgi:hypothetical protein
MDAEQNLIKARDEVFRKIGRNLLNFQKIELMLKHLITNGRLSGHMSELNDILERQASAVHKQTMGSLVGKFVDNTFLGIEESSQTSPEPKEPYFSFSFNVNADSNFYESKKQALKSLVDDRNDLIHHLLPRFNSESIDSCLETERYLDEQREKLIPEYDYLKSLIDDLNESRRLSADYLSSDEGIKQIELSFLQQSPLISLLLNISIQKPRLDGWTLLSVAGPEIRRILPEEMDQIKNRYGYKTLKEIILASEFFDILEEPTKKGGVRVLFLSKPELAYVAFNRLLRALLGIAKKKARADGWTLLSIAIQQIEQSFAEDFALIKEKSGAQSLKELILDTELFDLLEESLDNGSLIHLFKPKAELALGLCSKKN